MNSILVDLYTGNLNISEREPLSSPLRKLYLKEYNKLKEQFDCLLNEKEKLLLNELLEAKNSEMGVSDIGAFISGFRLAVLLMIEVLYSKRHLKTVQASRQNRPENMSLIRKSFFSYGEKTIRALYRNTNPRLKTIV